MHYTHTISLAFAVFQTVQVFLLRSSQHSCKNGVIFPFRKSWSEAGMEIMQIPSPPLLPASRQPSSWSIHSCTQNNTKHVLIWQWHVCCIGCGTQWGSCSFNQYKATSLPHSHIVNTLQCTSATQPPVYSSGSGVPRWLVGLDSKKYPYHEIRDQWAVSWELFEDLTSISEQAKVCVCARVWST